MEDNIAVSLVVQMSNTKMDQIESKFLVFPVITNRKNFGYKKTQMAQFVYRVNILRFVLHISLANVKSKNSMNPSFCPSIFPTKHCKEFCQF
jgi:hypothetical protein